MRKIVFLDVDGVLNDLKVLSTREELGKNHLLNFKSLVAATNCEIVLSSSWRVIEDWKQTLKFAFQEHNIPLWKSETPRIKNNIEIIPRRNEILLWVNENINSPAKLLVLDDESDANIAGHGLNDIIDKFIHTSMNTGLTVDHVNEAINFFK
jgi:hypothetical protein